MSSFGCLSNRSVKSLNPSVRVLRQLSYIKEMCDKEPEGEGVSALTTEERTSWAKVGA